MKDGSAGIAVPLKLVVDDAAAASIALSGVEVMGLSAFRDQLVELEDRGAGPGIALADTGVLGLCLSQQAAHLVAEDTAVSSLLAAAQVPVQSLGESPDVAEISAAAFDLLAARYVRMQAMAAGDQRALARLRRQYMEIQDDYADLGAWVHDHQTPERVTLREWPASADVFALEHGQSGIMQPLPAPVRGLIGVDLHIAETSPAGVLRMKAVRPIGPAFDGMTSEHRIDAGPPRWIRVQFPRAGGGSPEDVTVLLEFEAEDGSSALHLSLAPPSPFPDYCLLVGNATLAHPLALRVFKTLPRLEPEPLIDDTHGYPADGVTRLVRPNDFGAPSMLPYFQNPAKNILKRYPDEPYVNGRRDQNVIAIRPSTHLAVIAMLPGLDVAELRQVRGIVQNAQPLALDINFAVGAVASGQLAWGRVARAHIGNWQLLHPTEWGEVWYDLETPITGKVDLLLAAAMRGRATNAEAEALFHGFRLTCGASGGIGPVR